jgi:hypothetical protein
MTPTPKKTKGWTFERPRLLAAVCTALLVSAAWFVWLTWERCDDQVRINLLPPLQAGELWVVLSAEDYAASCRLVLPPVAPGAPTWSCSGDPVSVSFHEAAILGLNVSNRTIAPRVRVERAGHVLYDAIPVTSSLSAEASICKYTQAVVAWEAAP